MCGIVGLQLRDPALEPRLGRLLRGMLAQVGERGPDSAGFGLYGDPRLSPAGWSTVSVLLPDVAQPTVAAAVSAALGDGTPVAVTSALDMHVVSAPVGCPTLQAAVGAARPDAVVTGYGSQLAVLKGVGAPEQVADAFDLAAVAGWQAVAHTRMATESAVTAAHCHPFSVGPDLCLVHNGSFANHATIRRELVADGVRFDSDNDSEVGARFVARQLADGDDLDKALRRLCERFDGFYTLLVTTGDSFAVVRDAIACKPALVAETPAWVAMASEYRALAGLPGIETARVFEPAPEQVYVWTR